MLGDDLAAMRAEIADHMRRGAETTERFLNTLEPPAKESKGRGKIMTINRRSLLTVLAAGSGVLAMPFAARADGTLEAVKKRGTLRVGVTQAPPWFSKDPKTGQWSSGLGVSFGKAMADKLGVKMETVEVSWGNSIAALQADKIDIMFMIDATPERKQAVDFPETPLLWYALAALARDDLAVKTWEDLEQGRREDRRAAGLVDGPLRDRAHARRPTSSASPTMPRRSPPSSRAASMRWCCSIRRCSPRARSSARASSWCRRRPSGRPRARRCARATPRSSTWVNQQLAENYKSGQTEKWYEQAVADFGLDPKLAPPVMKEMIK